MKDCDEYSPLLLSCPVSPWGCNIGLCCCRAAAERDEQQNGDTVQAQLRKAQADVARRDVQLRTAQREAEQVGVLDFTGHPTTLCRAPLGVCAQPVWCALLSVCPCGSGVQSVRQAVPAGSNAVHSGPCRHRLHECAGMPCRACLWHLEHPCPAVHCLLPSRGTATHWLCRHGSLTATGLLLRRSRWQPHSSHPLALQARQQAATAQAAADAARKELGQAEAQARDQQAGLQGRAEALLEALRSLVRLALRSAAAMQAATQAMQAAGGRTKRQQPGAVRGFPAPGLCALVQPFCSKSAQARLGTLSVSFEVYRRLLSVWDTANLCQPLLASPRQCVWALA